MTRTVELKLFASLARRRPDNAEALPITPGETVQDVLARAGVPLEEIKLVFVNGVRKGLGASLEGGERVGVFPPVGGG